MTSRQVQPIYLVVPSDGYGRPAAEGPDPVITAFIDALAVYPAFAERVLVGVCEYSTFLNELCPLGDRLEEAARVAVSGFEGKDLKASFQDIARLVEYDCYRLTSQGIRVSRPLIAMILGTAPLREDEWEAAHGLLIGGDDEPNSIEPFIVAIAVDVSAQPFAAAAAHPAGSCAAATKPDQAGVLAASAVLDQLAGRR